MWNITNKAQWSYEPSSTLNSVYKWQKYNTLKFFPINRIPTQGLKKTFPLTFQSWSIIIANKPFYSETTGISVKEPIHAVSTPPVVGFSTHVFFLTDDQNISYC